MIRINDIKDDELRELAYKRLLEQKGEYLLKSRKDENQLLSACFIFRHTEEGFSFWWGVAAGKITKIS